ncbi:MAG: hypothetical protein ACI9WC_002693 [Arenicella sp.]|jgi:hypothetical protein
MVLSVLAAIQDELSSLQHISLLAAFIVRQLYRFLFACLETAPIVFKMELRMHKV